MSIWSPLDAETTAKIKYAKYHALRMAKAIKAGEDPNASNPVEEQPPVTDLEFAPVGDGLAPSSATYHPPTVESAPDSMQPSRPASVPQESLFAPPPDLRTATSPGVIHQEHDVSPIESTYREHSVGGGYFPAVPTSTSEAAPPLMPSAASDPSAPDPQFSATNNLISPPVLPDIQTPEPQNFYTQPQPSPLPPPPQITRPPPPPAAQARPPAPAAPLPVPVPLPPGSYRTDDDSVAMAQKHAKWAMSALNFEDVPTAVKELRLALQTLGAS